MEVIPLTLALSLLLSLTFIALFVREFSRPRRAGAEYDSLRPLDADLPPAACEGAAGRPCESKAQSAAAQAAAREIPSA